MYQFGSRILIMLQHLPNSHVWFAGRKATRDFRLVLKLSFYMVGYNSFLEI